MENGLKTSSACKGLLRSFLLQATWNSERMQNLGFIYALLPLLEDSDKEGRREKLFRHLEFFNTHPYMAGALAASVGKMERDGAKEDDVRAFKQCMMGPFGALGDSFFWFSLKPVAALVGVALAISGHLALAVIVPLVAYNIVHLWMRIWSYQGGIKEGAKLVNRISRFQFAKVNAALGIISGALVAAITILYFGFSNPFPRGESHEAAFVAFTALLALFSAVAVKRGLKPLTLIYLVAGFGLTAFLATP